MYYLVKCKVELTDEKPVTEQHLINGTSVVDCEAKITKFYTESSTKFETISIGETKIINVIE